MGQRLKRLLFSVKCNDVNVKQSIAGRWLRVAVRRTGGNVADVDVTVAITTAISSSVGKNLVLYFRQNCIYVWLQQCRCFLLELIFLFTYFCKL